LQWGAAHDNKKLLGYNIYQNGIRIGFTPLTYFDPASITNEQDGYFEVKAIDLQGNESPAGNEFKFGSRVR
jgi:mannobiose 2-epimerase